MATDPKEHLECSICTNDMSSRNPRLLECHHSFCEECLHKMVTYNRNLAVIKCPNCPNRITTLPPSGVSGLQMSFYISNMRESLDVALKTDFCYFCLSNDVRTLAKQHCDTCHRYMCSACAEQHITSSAYYQHSLRALERPKHRDICDLHKEPMEFMCKACFPIRSLCGVCANQPDACQHRDHIVEYGKGLESEKTSLETTIGSLESSKNIMEGFGEVFQSMKARINERSRQMKEEIDRQEKDLLERLRADLKIERFDELTLKAEQEMSMAKDALALPTNQALLNVSTGIRVRLENIITQIQNETKDVPEPSFQEGKSQPDIGTLYIKSETPRKVKKEKTTRAPTFIDIDTPRRPPVEKRPTYKKEVEKLMAGHVLSLAPADDGGVFVQMKEKRWVQYLELSGKEGIKCFHSQEKNYTIINITTSQGHLFAGLRVGQSSYVTRININSALNDHTYNPLKVMIMHDLYGLCAVDSDNLMIVSPPKLLKMNLKSATVSQLAQDVPRTSWISTVVCNSKKSKLFLTDGAERKILVYDSSGSLELEFGHIGRRQLKFPQQTAVAEDEHLFVIDSDTNSILEYAQNGTFIRQVLTSSDGLNRPTSIAYSPPHLWVADTKDGTLTRRIRRFTMI